MTRRAKRLAVRLMLWLHRRGLLRDMPSVAWAWNDLDEVAG